MVGNPAICCFVAIEKRHIAAALLLCPEDGTEAVQLSVVLFLAANNGYTNGCTTADKHKDNQQSRVACVAGLRNGVLRYGCCSRFRSGCCSRCRSGCCNRCRSSRCNRCRSGRCSRCRSGCCNRCRSSRCNRCRSGRCSRCRGGLVGVLVLQGGNGIFDSLCHGIYFTLLGNVLPTGNGIDGGFHSGEILVVILLQSICLGEGCIDLGVVGVLVLQGGKGIFDSFRHGIHFALLGNVFTTDNGIDSRFYCGEVFVIILLQSICFGNGFIDLSVVGR